MKVLDHGGNLGRIALTTPWPHSPRTPRECSISRERPPKNRNKPTPLRSSPRPILPSPSANNPSSTRVSHILSTIIPIRRRLSSNRVNSRRDEDYRYPPKYARGVEGGEYEETWIPLNRPSLISLPRFFFLFFDDRLRAKIGIGRCCDEKSIARKPIIRALSSLIRFRAGSSIRFSLFSPIFRLYFLFSRSLLSLHDKMGVREGGN